MRQHPNELIEMFRVMSHVASGYCKGTNAGAFLIPSVGKTLRVISCDAGGWDHVSVSRADRVPTWDDMAFVKSLFFKDDEVAMQLHVGKEDHINVNDHVLHMWRPQTPEERAKIAKEFGEDRPDWPTAGPIPLPPKEMV